MSTKRLLKSAMEKRGSSDGKRHRRRSDRRRVRLACRRVLRDAAFAEDDSLNRKERFGPGHRNRPPDERFLRRFLQAHLGQPVRIVEQALRRRIGSGYMARKLMEDFREVYEPDGYWRGAYGYTSCYRVDPEGVLRVDPCDHRHTLKGRRKTRKWRSDVSRWTGWRSIVQDSCGALYWRAWGYGGAVPFTYEDRTFWESIPSEFLPDISPL